MAVKIHFTIDQGVDLNKIIYRARYANGSPIDLSTKTALVSLRTEYGSANAFSLSASLNANGEITVTANSSVTANLEARRYVYDVVASDASERFVEGYVTVTPSVTTV